MVAFITTGTFSSGTATNFYDTSFTAGLAGLRGSSLYFLGAGNTTLTAEDVGILDQALIYDLSFADPGLNPLGTQRFDVTSRLEMGEGNDFLDLTPRSSLAAAPEYTVDVTVLGGLGDDILWGGAGVNRLKGGLGNDTMVGGNYHDILGGGGQNDQIHGLGGNDTIAGGEDQDVLHGGRGNDRLDGGSGDDQLFGEADDDVLAGGWQRPRGQRVRRRVAPATTRSPAERRAREAATAPGMSSSTWRRTMARTGFEPSSTALTRSMSARCRWVTPRNRSFGYPRT